MDTRSYCAGGPIAAEEGVGQCVLFPANEYDVTGELPCESELSAH